MQQNVQTPGARLRVRTDRLISALALVTGVLHLYAPIFGPWQQLRIVSLTLFLILALLMNPAVRGRVGAVRYLAGLWDLLMLTGAIGVGLYITVNYDGFIDATGQLTFVWAVVGTTLIVTLLEATRRTLGWPLVILALGFIAYAHWGQHFPLVIAHGGASLRDIIEFAFRDSAGIFGIAVGVMASYVVLFIIVGAILEKAGAAELMLDLAKRIAGRAVAGPSKVAVVSSSMMATISGSAVANVVTTGAFTIPLMKRTGMPAHVAGAVEAVASTGGIIMPPVMGAAAFIAAQNAGVPYSQFIIAAALPALLYYIALYLFVDLEGRRAGAVGLDVEEVRSFRQISRLGWWVPIPFAVLIYMLFAGFSPGRSAGMGLLTLVICVLTVKGVRPGARILIEGLVAGTRATAALMMAAATAGIVIAMIYVSGLGFRFTYIVLQLGGDSLLISLGLIGFITIILGMGLPITAAYLTSATLAVPVLTALGVAPVAAHLFVLYYSAISAITPPVALASFAAAGIANSGMWKTSFYSVKLGIVGYLVPFLFVDRGGLLITGTTFGNTAYALATAAAGLFALSTGIVGHFRKTLVFFERVVLIVIGILLAAVQIVWLDAAAVLLLALIVARNALSARPAFD